MGRVAIVLLLLTARVGAEPIAIPPEPADHALVAIGLLVGGGNKWLYGAFAGEAGVTLLRARVRVRARAFATLSGGTIESDWGGDFGRWGGGVEARWCTASVRTCWFADIDAGYERFTLYDQGSDFVRSDKGLVVGPRVGIDGGGAFRVRVTVDVLGHYGEHASRTSTKRDGFLTGGMSLAIGYQL